MCIVQFIAALSMLVSIATGAISAVEWLRQRPGARNIFAALSVIFFFIAGAMALTLLQRSSQPPGNGDAQRNETVGRTAVRHEKADGVATAPGATQTVATSGSTATSASITTGTTAPSDERPCENFFPRGGLASPPSYSNLMAGLGSRPDVFDGRIVDALLEDSPRRIAVKVEAPDGVGTLTVGVSLQTIVQRFCEKGSRDDLRCGRYVRVQLAKASTTAAMIFVIHEADLGRNDLKCPEGGS